MRDRRVEVSKTHCSKCLVTVSCSFSAADTEEAVMTCIRPSKAVFIDIDNTLLDFSGYVRETMETGFAHFGLKPYEPYMYDIFRHENDMLWRQIELGELVFDELKKIRWRNVFRALDIEFDGPTFETYFRDALYNSAIPMPGAMELLEILSSSGRYIICAASNGPYEQQLHRLEIAGMSQYFDYVFISERIGVSKPAAEFFDRAFAELNEGREVEDRISPDKTVMVGDSLTSDMAGGRNYGMKTCYYSRGKATGSDSNSNGAITAGSSISPDVDTAAVELSDVPGCIEELLK